MAEEDRLSNLPTEIIHHIMFSLPLLDVIQVSVLSKRFNSVWRTFPVIEFDQELFATRPKRPSNHSKADLHSDKFRFSDKLKRFSDYTADFLRRRGPESFLQKFKLRTLFIPDLDRYIKFALRSRVQELEINSKLYFELSERILGMRITSDVFAAKSIRVLKLTGLDLGLRNLILSDSSLIQELSLNKCDLLETVRVLSDKLLSLELERCWRLQIIEIDAPNLQHFRCGGGILRCGCGIKINMRTFESLKSLSLRNAAEHWIEENIPKFICLEKLSIEGYEHLKKVKISHRRLKMFEFYNSGNEAELELELITPNLRSFLYEGMLPSHTIVTSTRFDARLFLKRISASYRWFLALRHFLISFDHCKVLTLEFEKQVVFPKELKERWIAPMFSLKHMKVEINSNLWTYRELVAFMLQLSPRLNTLSIIQNSNSQGPIERVIKFKYVKEVAEQQSSCCKRRPVKCWRHHLTSITMENFEDINDKENLIKFFKDNTKISKKQDVKSIVCLF